MLTGAFEEFLPLVLDAASSGQPAQLERKIGSRNAWSPGAALSAVVVVVAGKRGKHGPAWASGSIGVAGSLPDGALVNLEQYEFLMNLLDRSVPWA